MCVCVCLCAKTSSSVCVEMYKRRLAAGLNGGCPAVRAYESSITIDEQVPAYVAPSRIGRSPPQIMEIDDRRDHAAIPSSYPDRGEKEETRSRPTSTQSDVTRQCQVADDDEM